ncbi:unconventional myosin-Va-like protein [Lates japonicus]|uniref:Unconventional myosin-Va-like protein n=1 Tax=Lates japonicus TaxID=270547 RepID=A0AAD3RMX9_LATJO|nr:unconventional myosin-Va-like protein [Lates japonicus]
MRLHYQLENELQELLEAREQECVKLRRELKELRNTVSLRRLLAQVFTPETSSCPPRPTPAAAVTGLLECRKRDETKLIKNLITDIRVDSALSLPPGLPAGVIFLCVRQADCSGDQTRARSLCSAAVTAMKAALKASSDLCIQAYQQLLSITETRLQNIIGSERARTPGLSRCDASYHGVSFEGASLHTASRQDLPSTLMEQAFHQLTYLISASALNSLLLRKDMCCWSRGMQIRLWGGRCRRRSVHPCGDFHSPQHWRAQGHSESGGCQ